MDLPPALTGPEPSGEDAAVVDADTTEPSVLDVVVDRLREAGPPAHEVWLPPLEGRRRSRRRSPRCARPPTAACAHRASRPNGSLRLLLGLVDRPYEQRRDLLWADLAGAAGHVVVAGGPQSGKSTTLRALVAAAALTHTPAELAFQVVDLGGGTLGGTNVGERRTFERNAAPGVVAAESRPGAPRRTGDPSRLDAGGVGPAGVGPRRTP